MTNEIKQTKIFYPKDLYDSRYRGYIFPLLKAFLKNRGYTDSERINHYGISSGDITFVEDPMFADVFILPMSWNYYVLNGKKESALKFIDHVSHFGKKVFIYNAGDIGLKISFFPNVLIFRLAVNKFPRKENETIIPSFIQDPLKTFYSSRKIYMRPYMDKPQVGFCGFAKTSRVDAAKELMKIKLQNILSLLGLRNKEPQQFLSSSYFRGRVLGILEDSPKIKTNFIVRKNYRAGIMHDITHNTVIEFYNNIKDSDYVLCARGSGNFSVRFYETLAMGRIPVYVNTNGGLPLDNQIEWKDHVVWVEKSEINCIGEKINDFHKKMDSGEFQKLLLNNRKLWEDRLTLGAYFKTIFASEILRNGNEE